MKQSGPASAPPSSPASQPVPSTPPRQTSPRPSPAGPAARAVPAAQPESRVPAAPPSSPSPPKRKSKAVQKKKTYSAPPNPNTLPSDLIDSIKSLHAEGRTILANKRYREATGTSFRDAEKEVKKILGM